MIDTANGVSGAAAGSGGVKPRRGIDHPACIAKRFKPGQSGNPKGSAKINRPLLLAIRRFYEKNPDKLEELVRVIHEVAVGRRRNVGGSLVAAWIQVARKLDLEHLRDDGNDQPAVTEGITLVIDQSRPPERRGPQAADADRPAIEPISWDVAEDRLLGGNG